MCIEVAMALASVAQSVVSFAAAEEDYNSRSEMWKQNYTNALAAGRDEQNQLQLRMVQEQEAHTQKQQLTAIEGAEISAEAEVSAASGGVSGVSLNNILLGINRKIGMKQEADKTNHHNTILQVSEQMKATNTNIENRINSVQKPTAPNPLGYALQGVGGALKAFS